MHATKTRKCSNTVLVLYYRQFEFLGIRLKMSFSSLFLCEMLDFSDGWWLVRVLPYRIIKLDLVLSRTKSREKYTPGNYALPQYSAVPGLAPPNSKALPGYHMQEEIEARIFKRSLNRAALEQFSWYRRVEQKIINASLRSRALNTGKSFSGN